MKEDLGLNTVREVLQSKTGEDQDIFKFVDDEMEAYYNRSPKNAELKYKIRERQTHIVKVDANGQLTLNNKTIAKEDLKEVLKKTMVEHKRLAKEKYNSAEDQVGGVLFSPEKICCLLCGMLLLKFGLILPKHREITVRNTLIKNFLF